MSREASVRILEYELKGDGVPKKRRRDTIIYVS